MSHLCHAASPSVTPPAPAPELYAPPRAGHTSPTAAARHHLVSPSGAPCAGAPVAVIDRHGNRDKVTLFPVCTPDLPRHQAGNGEADKAVGEANEREPRRHHQDVPCPPETQVPAPRPRGHHDSAGAIRASLPPPTVLLHGEELDGLLPAAASHDAGPHILAHPVAVVDTAANKVANTSLPLAPSVHHTSASASDAGCDRISAPRPRTSTVSTVDIPRPALDMPPKTPIIVSPAAPAPATVDAKPESLQADAAPATTTAQPASTQARANVGVEAPAEAPGLTDQASTQHNATTPDLSAPIRPPARARPAQAFAFARAAEQCARTGSIDPTPPIVGRPHKVSSSASSSAPSSAPSSASAPDQEHGTSRPHNGPAPHALGSFMSAVAYARSALGLAGAGPRTPRRHSPEAFVTSVVDQLLHRATGCGVPASHGPHIDERRRRAQPVRAASGHNHSTGSTGFSKGTCPQQPGPGQRDDYLADPYLARAFWIHRHMRTGWFGPGSPRTPASLGTGTDAFASVRTDTMWDNALPFPPFAVRGRALGHHLARMHRRTAEAEAKAAQQRRHRSRMMRGGDAGKRPD